MADRYKVVLHGDIFDGHMEITPDDDGAHEVAQLFSNHPQRLGMLASAGAEGLVLEVVPR